MSSGSRPGRSSARTYVPRFAGEVFAHAANPADGPEFRKLVATQAWKQPPGAAVRAQVAT